jgi:hypothetical protein
MLYRSAGGALSRFPLGGPTAFSTDLIFCICSWKKRKWPDQESAEALQQNEHHNWQKQALFPYSEYQKIRVKRNVHS